MAKSEVRMANWKWAARTPEQKQLLFDFAGLPSAQEFRCPKNLNALKRAEHQQVFVAGDDESCGCGQRAFEHGVVFRVTGGTVERAGNAHERHEAEVVREGFGNLVRGEGKFGGELFRKLIHDVSAGDGLNLPRPR